MNRRKTVFMQNTTKGAAACGQRRPRSSRISRAQSAVEFAMIAPLVFIVMFVGIQYAIIGQAALALSQGASAIARYAAVNPGTVSSGAASGLPAAVQAVLSPTILTNSGGDLTVTLTSNSGTSTNATTTPGLGDTCIISLSYNTSSKIFLPNTFFGVPLFPSTMAAQDSELYE
jgi:Flp pilus assembly protein TadG